MARILLSFFSNVTWAREKYKDSFVEGFINALQRMGNDCLSVRVNDFIDNQKMQIKRDILKEDIIRFSPDLIITFNNVLPDYNIYSYVNCPIAFFSSDSSIWWQRKDLIKKYFERYHFFHFSPGMLNDTKNIFEDISDKNNHLFGSATDFRRVDLVQDTNITFVGSLNIWNKGLVDYFNKFGFYTDYSDIKNKFIEDFTLFKKDPLKNYIFNKNDFDNEKIKQMSQLVITAQMRLKIVNQLTDLGLKIYTAPLNINDLLLYHFDIWKCISCKLVCTLADIENVYNRSFLTLNLPHSQEGDGFSWRVADILASQSCLVSTPKPYLKQLFKDYMDIPTYESDIEAKDLCIKLLNDDELRKDIVEASNIVANKRLRFEDKFKRMEEILNINISNNGKEGQIIDLDTEFYLKEQNEKLKNFKYKIYYKIWKKLDRKLRKKGIIK